MARADVQAKVEALYHLAKKTGSDRGVTKV